MQIWLSAYKRCAQQCEHGGGAGNRTRVLRNQNRASTGVVCLSFSQFRISYTRVFDKLICETVLSTYSQRYADEELSSDARFQSESAPGLTDLGLAYAASAKSLRLLSAVSCARISWFTRSFRLPRPASPISTAKVETVHPHGCGKHRRHSIESLS